MIIILFLLQRSLNVISLAGLAFAVGMIVDNAIVVLENIFSHVQQGKSPIHAAIDGTQEVGGAMLASTLTTVAVFAPSEILVPLRQSLTAGVRKEGMEYHDSLYQAVRDRLRPIFMSVGTSVLGMLPLAIIPGRGAELYQGLGITLTGGLALSTVLTPTVIPALM